MKRFQQIMAPILAALVFAMGAQVSLNLHLCMGEVEAVSFYTPADPCSEMPESQRPHRPDGIDKSSCCDDVVLLFSVDDDFQPTAKTTSPKIQFPQIVAAFTPNSSAAFSFPQLFFHPKIPDLPRPGRLIAVLVQCFRL